jgi:hypothetical protein
VVEFRINKDITGKFFMPVHKVMTSKNGKPVPGYQWGHHGKIYTGPGAQEKAAKQGQAAYANGYKGKK